VKGAQLVVQGQKVVGVLGTDQVSGETHEFQASNVVNCAGPWCREVATQFHQDVPELFPFSVAFNVLLGRELDSDYALALTPKLRGAQTFFLHGWKGMILAGTGHFAGGQTRQDSTVRRQDVHTFLENLNRAAPGLDLQPSDVRRVHWGLLPAVQAGRNRPTKRPLLYDHAAHGGPLGLYSVSGVKQTTSRLVAEQMLQRIYAGQNRSLPPAGRPPRPKPGESVPLQQFEKLLQEHPEEAAGLVRRVWDLESVVRLDDLLLRRTDWGVNPSVGARIGGQIATLLGWDPGRTAEEMKRLDSGDWEQGLG
jgi:glycerol-3-phosphate dehydrogenase